MSISNLILAPVVGIALGSLGGESLIIENQAQKFDEYVQSLQAQETKDSDLKISVTEKTPDERKLRADYFYEENTPPIPIAVDVKFGLNPVMKAEVLPGGSPDMSAILEKAKIKGEALLDVQFNPKTISISSQEFQHLSADGRESISAGALHADGKFNFVNDQEKSKLVAAEINGSMGAVQISNQEGSGWFGPSDFTFNLSNENAFKGDLSVNDLMIRNDKGTFLAKRVILSSNGLVFVSDDPDAEEKFVLGRISMPWDEEAEEEDLKEATGKEMVIVPELTVKVGIEDTSIKTPDGTVSLAPQNASLSVDAENGTNMRMDYKTEGITFKDPKTMVVTGPMALGGSTQLVKPQDSEDIVASVLKSFLSIGRIQAQTQGGEEADIQPINVTWNASLYPNLTGQSKFESGGGFINLGKGAGEWGKTVFSINVDSDNETLSEKFDFSTKDINVDAGFINVQVSDAKAKGELFVPDIEEYRMEAIELIFGNKACEYFGWDCNRPKDYSKEFVQYFQDGKAGARLTDLALRTNFGNFFATGYAQVFPGSTRVVLLDANLETMNPLILGALKDVLNSGYVRKDGPKNYSTEVTGDVEGDSVVLRANGEVIDAVPWTGAPKKETMEDSQDPPLNLLVPTSFNEAAEAE